MRKILSNMVFIKKFFILLATLAVLVSCSMDNDNQEFDLAFLPVISVEAPEYVVPGQTSYFKLYYKRPTDCYFVNGFEYIAEEDSTRTVAIQALVVEDAECLSLESEAPESTSMPFQCPPLGANTSYTFKFYSGTDASYNGDTFIEITVPVQH